MDAQIFFYWNSNRNFLISHNILVYPNWKENKNLCFQVHLREIEIVFLPVFSEQVSLNINSIWNSIWNSIKFFSLYQWHHTISFIWRGNFVLLNQQTWKVKFNKHWWIFDLIFFVGVSEKYFSKNFFIFKNHESFGSHDHLKTNDFDIKNNSRSSRVILFYCQNLAFNPVIVEKKIFFWFTSHRSTISNWSFLFACNDFYNF